MVCLSRMKIILFKLWLNYTESDQIMLLFQSPKLSITQSEFVWTLAIMTLFLTKLLLHLHRVCNVTWWKHSRVRSLQSRDQLSMCHLLNAHHCHLSCDGNTSNFSRFVNLDSCNSKNVVKDFERVPHVILANSYANMSANHRLFTLESHSRHAPSNRAFKSEA